MGNNRVVFKDAGNGTAEKVQENHYYPFGMNMGGEWSQTSSTLANNYLYNGKELNDDFGLGWYDYGARFYDPAIGRWNAVDPLADVYSSISPYTYVLNNPLKYIDPDGMRVDPTNILNSENQDIVDAFNLFASSEEGIALLSKFAEKGQTIGDHTFESDGKFHSQGINLSFNSWEGNSEDSEGFSTSFGANGVTRTKETEDGSLEIG